MQFEWHEAKRAANLAKHGLDFREVALVFAEATLVEPAHSVGDEVRFTVIGPRGNSLVAVICTMRGQTVRVISMRKARKDERQRYQALFG